METGEAESELRYWMQAGMYGVLMDVMLEHKVRVNQAYEIAQIMKSGDCYDTPYYSKPVEVVDESGNVVGYVYVNMKRSGETVDQDVLKDVQLVLKSNVSSIWEYKCDKCGKGFDNLTRKEIGGRYVFYCPYCGTEIILGIE